MIKVTKKIGDVNESIECETVGELLEYERARDIPITEIAEVFEG